MLWSNYIFLILGALCGCIHAKRSMFYRKDYSYIEEYDAFYKMHWDGISWRSAFKVCDDEGAQLFYPKMIDEWTVVQKLSQNLAVQPNFTEIVLGLHDQFHVGEFITVDGHSTESPLNLEKSSTLPDNCVMMDIMTGLFRIDECLGLLDGSAPFICKKVEDLSCPTVDHEYKYVKPLNKCYKVHKKEKDWNSAMRTCFMEGSLLAVFETDSEISAIKTLDLKSDKDYFVGFRKMISIIFNDFYTVKGKRYENPYFRDWYQPGAYEGSNCGIFNPNANSMTLENCHNERNFICEMDIN